MSSSAVPSSDRVTWLVREIDHQRLWETLVPLSLSAREVFKAHVIEDIDHVIRIVERTDDCDVLFDGLGTLAIIFEAIGATGHHLFFKETLRQFEKTVKKYDVKTRDKVSKLTEEARRIKDIFEKISFDHLKPYEGLKVIRSH